MSGEMHDRLKKLICRLKESTARGEAATSAAEEKIFRDLAFVYDHDLRNAAQNDLGVAIEQYNDLRRPERFIQFKRVTAVYERDMYNKFFVPLWAVAMNADKSVGYVLSPKLTPLREVLKDLKESYQTSDDYYDKLNQVLRLCVAPIALAIDALHTPIFNKRMMYHHRDICIDNIYMRVRKGIDSSGQENVEHDDARLKLTNLAREAHVLPNEADGLLSLTEYYHHADVKYDREPYDRKHDWYSFGVYILEVLHLTLPVTIQTGFRQIQEYIDVIHIYDSWIQSPLKKDAIRSFVLRYLDIAFKCLKLEPNELQPLNYEIPDEMKQRFLEPSQTFQMYFEYSVSTWTAELLWMYEESRPKETPDGSVAEVCQACLLHPTETISTNQHGRGNQPKCDENCQHHCLFCYTNEERLFCSRQHGTTGTYVDHRYSYALILYSQSFEEMCKKDTESAGINLFKEEADMLAKALKSKYICGLLEGNIHVRPVYGNGTSEDCLKRHCEEMRKLIHGDGKSLCSNDTSYTLFVLYFGHSYHGCDKTVGDWCPSFTHTSDDTFEPLRLKRALVHYHMTSIQKCTNYGTGQPECQAACLGVNYLVNPCGPSPGSTAHQWSADKDVSISERSQPLVVTGAATCGITDWFCQMLQGLYHRDCSGKPHLQDIQKRENYHSKCKVPLGKIDVCFKLARYIYEELGDALIDGECLRIHQKHLKTHNGYTELMVQIDDEHCKPVLAYYKPQGVFRKVFSTQAVFRKVFSTNEGEEQVQVDMGSEITCEKVKDAVFNQIKDTEQYRGKLLDIVLRSNDQVKYPAVSDDNIRDILESSVLFYDVISSYDRIFEGSKRGDVVTLKLLLNNSSNCSQLVLQVDGENCTALHYALDSYTARVLVESVKPIEQKKLLWVTSSFLPRTALDAAAADNRADVVEYLSGLALTDETLLGGHLLLSHLPLHHVSSANVARKLVECVPSDRLCDLLLHTDEYDRTALHIAAGVAPDEVIEYLCELSATHLPIDGAGEFLCKKDRWGATALHYARTGEATSLLIDAAQDKWTFINIADHKGSTALHYAHVPKIAATLIDTAQKDKWTYIKITNNKGKTALHCAPTKEIVCSLIEAAVDQSSYVKIADNKGRTALHLATSTHSVDIARLLIEAVVDKWNYVNMADNNGRTALHLSTSTVDIVSLLIEAGQEDKLGNITTIDKEGKTALHYAITGETARHLIEAANEKLAYLNIKDNEENTALMSMVERGAIHALDYTLEYIASEPDFSLLGSALLMTNKNNQNMFHLACISPLIEKFYELLEEYLDCVKVEDLFTADIFNNTPFTYMVARFSTCLVAQFILKFPLCQRRILLLWKNQMQTNCLTVSVQKQFCSEFYMQKVLCCIDGISYRERFQHVISLTNDHLDSPEKFIQYDIDLFRTIKYALNEYSLLDQPMISTQSEVPALTSSVQRYEQEQTAEMDENSVTAQSTLHISYFDADERALADIQRELYELDVRGKHSEPKVIVVKCSTSDLVRYLSPPGPDFIIITLVSVHSASDMFSNLQTKSFGDLEQLLGYLKIQDIVKYININSTMARHCGSSSKEPADDHVLLRGASKGKSLIICNRRGTKTWEIEHGHACRVMEQLGLQVKCLYDKSADDMLIAIAEFSKSSGHGSLTALSIMSHGNLRGHICGDDGKGFCSVQQVVDALCQPDIQSVNKLVFLHFCRGPISGSTNRTNTSWECTDLRDTAQMTLFSPIRANVGQDRLDSVRQIHPFPSVDVPPINCYICYSTLPDTMSYHLRSTGQLSQMFDSLSEHLTNIYKCNTLYKRVDSTHHTVCSIPSPEQDVDVSTQQQLPRVELIPLLIDVAAIAREKSRFTQYMNLCYAIDKDSKPLVVEILPANK